MPYKFTERAEKALEISNEIAIEFGHNYIGTEHLLYGLIKEGEGVASKVLENQNVTEDAVLGKIEELIGRGETRNAQTIGFTPRTKRVIENAFIESRKLGSDYIGTEHILIGIMREADSIAVRIMLDLNVNPQKLYNEIVKIINEYDSNEEKSKSVEKKNSYNSTPTLNQFGSDLTKIAKEGKLDPVIGRKKEIERIIQILSRRTKNKLDPVIGRDDEIRNVIRILSRKTKNNPCLIGEPGVRKNSSCRRLSTKNSRWKYSRNFKK